MLYRLSWARLCLFVFVRLLEGFDSSLKPFVLNVVSFISFLYLDAVSALTSHAEQLKKTVPDVEQLIADQASESLRAKVFEKPEIEALAMQFQSINNSSNAFKITHGIHQLFRNQSIVLGFQ